MVTPNPRLLNQAVVDRLIGWLPANVTVYNGEVPDRPPTIGTTGRVKPYVVCYGGIGMAHHGRRQIPRPWVLGWTIQVTCVGGYLPDAQHVAMTVRDLLTGWAPEVPDAVPARLVEVFSAPVIRDPDTDPPRFFTTPQWRLATATAA